MASPQGFLPGLCLFLATIFFAVAAGTAYWTVAGSSGSGPYKYCVTSSDCTAITQSNIDSTGCNNSNSNDGSSTGCGNVKELETVRAFIVIATVFAGIGCLLSGAHAGGKSNTGGFHTVCFAMIAGISGIIAMACWIDLSKQGGNSPSYGYSFGLEVAGWCLSLIAACSAATFHGYRP